MTRLETLSRNSTGQRLDTGHKGVNLTWRGAKTELINLLHDGFSTLAEFVKRQQSGKQKGAEGIIA